MTVSSIVLGCALKGGLESATLIIHESARESAKNRPASCRTRAFILLLGEGENNKSNSKTERLESNSGERKAQDRSLYGRRSS